MPIIRPTSELRNNFNQISEICHKEGEPVFITKNGHGDLVVMSLALYEKMEAQVELYQKLSVAEAESASGAPTIPHKELMQQLKAKFNGKEI